MSQKFALIYSRNRQLFSDKNSTVRSLLSTRQQTANDFLNINHTLRNVFIWKQILMKMKWICSVTKNNEMENSITEDELLTGVKIYPWWYNKHLITCKKIKDHSCACVCPVQHKGVSWTEERTKVRCYTVCPCLLRNGLKGRFFSFDSVCACVCVCMCVFMARGGVVNYVTEFTFKAVMFIQRKCWHTDTHSSPDPLLNHSCNNPLK